MRQSRRIGWVLLIGVLLSTAVSYFVSRRLLQPAAAREEAFGAISTGELRPDAAGTIVLPERWKIGSVDGKAYATHVGERTLWVLFLTERGVGAQMRGYAFCTKPAAAQATGLLILNYPLPEGSQAEVTVTRILNPSCFEVVNQRKTAAASRP